ncbi:O-methyltransferase [Nitrosovibrio sp. Nv17]|uniref:O-methyltransferase n=1 Tax=Nitrosovibrio sp. Nv17 TaxID=1855339 RepID=UPI00090914DA|nr:O-methyltransferase [Nitrosovibrio sp. Nv17]SFW17528.1 Predicted O-methyltransferase YrrM [Nitrosovibrio sp. Nv17]
MSLEQWSAVDEYFSAMLIPSDPVLDAVLDSCVRAALPPIGVAPNQGKLLYLLARIRGAGRILEIGTLGGYSTIWLARALAPGGKLVSLEVSATHAQVARENVEAAGLSDAVSIMVGRATDTLARLAAEGVEPFDLVFIDADKENNPVYLKAALRFTRPGSLIVCDNVVRNGRVLDAGSDDADVAGTRRYFELLAEQPRLISTAIQTVGVKGWDGLSISLVEGG